jgi:alkylation response protein AidB-like acyl-CoA dehydrogenase
VVGARGQAAPQRSGAKGYATEFEIERDLRDGIGGLLYSGTNDIQRNVVAQISGL